MSQDVNGTDSVSLTTGRTWHFKCGWRGPGSLTGQEATVMAAGPGSQLVEADCRTGQGVQRYPSPGIQMKSLTPLFYNT